MPQTCQTAEGEGGGARSPLKVAQLENLRQAFRQVSDPRAATSRRHPLPAMLGLIALGLLMGARDVLDFWRKVARLTQNQRPALGLCVRDKQIRRITMPGYNALNAFPQAHASQPASLLKRPQPGL